jgi:hypothetical protein
MATIESGKWIAFWLKSACCSTCTKKIKKGDLSGEAGWRGLDWQNETEGEVVGGGSGRQKRDRGVLSRFPTLTSTQTGT